MQPLFRPSAALPLFPLPNYYLYPGVVAPLHVFETRYRQMVNDLLDGPGRFVVTAVKRGAERSPFGPATLPLGTLVEILRHERLEDGRYALLLAALTRVRLHEVPSTRLYRLAEVEEVPETDPDIPAVAPLRSGLVAALADRATTDEDLPDDVTVGRLADLLLHALQPESARAVRAYLETDPLLRARLALVWHGETLPTGADGDMEAAGDA